MAAWLVQLRSRLLLPAEAKASDAADREAAQLRCSLARLDAAQAAARWLDRQPRLGRDVFSRGRPELVGIGTTTLRQVDVIEFLWASLALFDDDLPPPDTTASYRPHWLDLHAIPDARERILRRMANCPNPCRLDHYLCRQLRTCQTGRSGLEAGGQLRVGLSPSRSCRQGLPRRSLALS